MAQPWYSTSLQFIITYLFYYLYDTVVHLKKHSQKKKDEKISMDVNNRVQIWNIYVHSISKYK